MGSKAILFLGFVLVFTLLLATEVAPNDLAETSNAKSAKGLDDAKYGGETGGTGDGYGPAGDKVGAERYRCRHGCCRCCTFAGDGYGPAGNKGGVERYRCRHGCCRCCTFAGEVAEDAHPQAKPNN